MDRQSWVPGQLPARGEDRLDAKLGMLLPSGREAGGAAVWVCRALQQSQTHKELRAGMQFNAACSPLSRTTGQSPPHSQGEINSLSEGRRNTPFKRQLILFLSGPWSSCWPLSGGDFTSETPLLHPGLISILTALG